MIFPWLGVLLAVLTGAGEAFPPELVKFSPYENNPVFEGSGPGHWDENIRERGWILREDGVYHLWYTGYTTDDDTHKLGYATSPDGIVWIRYPGNPIYSEGWIEDMMVVKQGDTYYMFAEGLNDRAQLLTSTDRIHWTLAGTLDIRLKDGSPLPPGPFGTPAAFYEDGTWYLLYERNDDAAIWAATSKDLKTWTNLQDEPVIEPGPDAYDSVMVAVNQVVKRDGRYYAYYHGHGVRGGPENWTTNVAVSTDLLHWEKYPGNPLLRENKSSGFLVDDGEGYRLYTMHPAVCLHQR